MTSKTSETDKFSFSFGENGVKGKNGENGKNGVNKKFCSGFDQAATYLYEILGDFKEKNPEQIDLMVEIENYFEKCLL